MTALKRRCPPERRRPRLQLLKSNAKLIFVSRSGDGQSERAIYLSKEKENQRCDYFVVFLLLLLNLICFNFFPFFVINIIFLFFWIIDTVWFKN